MDLRLPAVLLAALVPVGCGDDGSERAARSVMPSPTTVTIERSRFDAPDLAVPAGTTVAFVNSDAFAHTVTSADGSSLAFDSGEMAQGDVFEITLDRPGAHAYFCTIHPTMRGTVMVG